MRPPKPHTLRVRAGQVMLLLGAFLCVLQLVASPAFARAALRQRQGWRARAVQKAL